MQLHLDQELLQYKIGQNKLKTTVQTENKLTVTQYQ